MRQENSTWNRYCKYFNYFSTVNLSLDISRMSFAEEFFAELEQPVQAAFAAMQDLENGALANPDEQRMVGHYWLRAPGLAPSEEIKASITQAIFQVKAFAKDVHTGKITAANGSKFTHLLLVGIGGSALGPQLVANALWDKSQPLEVLFCDNTDPDGIRRTFSQLGEKLTTTLTLVISKSGGTIETANGQFEAKHAYNKLNLNFAAHAAAITMPGSKLDKLAESEGWLARFPLWDWVGGRTSLFSPVGLVPAALQGIGIDEFLAGAAAMDTVTRTSDSRINPAMHLALMWFVAGNGKGAKDMVIIPYKDRMSLFAKYLQQLVMESLGKKKNLAGEVVHQGIAVYGNKGSTDQHAYVQQLRDGLNNFFVTFIEVLADYTDIADGKTANPVYVKPGITSGDYLGGFLQGTRKALYQSGRESITITIDQLNPHSLGALIALYERAVGYYALLINVNAYHQPGVEAGKKASSQVIEIHQALVKKFNSDTSTGVDTDSTGVDTGPTGTAYSAEELAEIIGFPEEPEIVFRILERLTANPYRNIVRIGERLPGTARYRKKQA